MTQRYDDNGNTRRHRSAPPTPVRPPPDKCDADVRVLVSIAPIFTRLQSAARLREALFSEDGPRRLEATCTLRRWLSDQHPPIDRVIEEGFLPRLVEFLQDDDAVLQVGGVLPSPSLTYIAQAESAWAITNIASGASSNTHAVVSTGAVPQLIKLLSSPHDDVQTQAIWALGNISGEGPACRDCVLAGGAMEPLARILGTELKQATLRNATWTMSNFCRGRASKPPWEQISPALGSLAKRLQSVDEEVLVNVCWALSSLSDGVGVRAADSTHLKDIIDSGICPRLVELLLHPSNAVRVPALRCVGNIVTGDMDNTQAVIDAGALPHLLKLLSSSRRGIRQEACWTISNITAGSTSQLAAVINAQILPPMIDILRHDEFKIRREACWAVSNATCGGLNEPAHIRYLVAQGAIHVLCSVLLLLDSKIVDLALVALDNILTIGESDKLAGGPDAINTHALEVEAFGGMVTIHKLQQHDSVKISLRARHMMETYFKDDPPSNVESDEPPPNAVSETVVRGD